MKIIFLLIFVFFTKILFAQIDSVSSKPKFVFSFDNRRSFVASKNAKISGLKFGLEFKKKWRVGIGFYGLATTFNKDLVKTDALGLSDTLNVNFSFSYLSPYVEYVIFYNNKWEFTLPVQLGFGTIKQTNNANGIIINERGLSLLEAGISGHYKIFDWIGIGSGIGYRHIFTKDKAIRKSLNAPVYIIKVKLFVGFLYKKVFKKGN